MARGMGPGTRIKRRDQLWCSWGDEEEPAKSLKMCRLESGQRRLQDWGQMGPRPCSGALCCHTCGAALGLAWGHGRSYSQSCPALGGIEITRVGSKGKVGLAPCDAVVSGASGVSRIGGGRFPVDFPIFVPHLVLSSLLTSVASIDLTRALCVTSQTRRTVGIP